MDSKKIERAIKLLQSIPQDGPIELAYSTGKDSDVIFELAKMAGIPFVPIYKNTTCDPAGSIQHARGKGVEIRQPKKNLLQLIEENGWPSRFMRFCCRYLKEYKIYDRAILGIRRAESTARAKRYTEPEECRVFAKGQKCRQYYPILDWTAADIADFVAQRKLKLHPHYYNADGTIDFDRRVGCIGCPLKADNGVKDFTAYPQIFRARVKAFCRWWEKHPDSKTAQKFPDPYHAIYMKLFCRSMEQYEEQTGGLFGNMDVKSWLERRFNVTL